MTPPTGTVTFLFTDIEGSTQRWESNRAAMAVALPRHNVILDRSIAAHAGHVFKTVGDAYCTAFAHAADALDAALDAQRALTLERWDEVAPSFGPLLVRMGLHTGLVELQDGDYFGRPVNRVARVMSAAHGGQVLLSLATQQLVRDALPKGCELIDLGVHRLKGLEHTEHLFRLIAPGFPDVTTPPDTAEALPAGTYPPVDLDALPVECPYRGLAAFREEDAAFFFGREVFTERLSAALGAKPMVGVIGPSGSGKSSVVFAGLVPGLRLPSGGNGKLSAPTADGAWTVLSMRPGSQPYQALAGTLVPLLETELTETARLVEVERLATALADGTLSLAKVVSRIREKHPAVCDVLLVADQFEELYTLCPDEASQRAFQDLLFDAVHTSTDRDGRLKLALTLRADFMGHALAYRPFADAIQDHNVILGPMNRQELARAIRLPAETQGRAFETGLVERIADDVGDKAGALPLLEFALTKLWEEQQAGWLTHEAYERIGRVEGAVARHADTVYDALAEPKRERARRVFVQLVQPGEGTEDTRRLATIDELGEDWPLVRKLADARLVVTNRDEAGHETAEVVHEALIRSWGRLREWMNADRTFRSWQERLRFALRQWAGTDHDEGILLRGAPLAEAEGWLAQRPDSLSTEERGFVEAGIELRDRRVRELQAQRQRELELERQRANAERLRAEEHSASVRRLRRRETWLAGALVVAAIMVLAALVFGQRAAESAVDAERAGKVAHARELIAFSLANLRIDPQRSALLALQAASLAEEADPSLRPDVETALHQAVRAVRNVTLLRGHDGFVFDVAYRPDGRRLATAGADGAVRVWELPAATAALTLTAHSGEVWGVDFSPDGSLLASVGRDGKAVLWNPDTGQQVRVLAGHEGHAYDVKFSPDGSHLATCGLDDGMVRVWDVDTGAQVASFFLEEAPIAGRIAFSPDGARLAVSHGSHERVSIWDLQSQQLVKILPSEKLGNPTGVAYSSDGRVLGVVFTGGTRLYDVLTDQVILTLRGHSKDVFGLAFSPDSQRIATASADATARMWDPTDGHPLGDFLGHASPVYGIAFSPDGSRLATTAGAGITRLWDVATEHEVWTVLPSFDDLEDLIVSPDGAHIVIASDDGTARVLDSLSGRMMMTLTHGTGRVLGVDIVPSGTLVATVGDDPAVKLWDVSTGKIARTLAGHEGPVSRVGFDADGDSLATIGVDKTVRIWRTATGQQILRLERPDSTTVDIELIEDGRVLLTSGTDGIRAYDAETGQALWELPDTAGGTRSIAVNADETRLAASDTENMVHVWSLPERTKLLTLRGHLSGVADVEFNRDGSLLATASSDNTAKIWNSASGQLVVTLVGHTGMVADVAFSPDSTRLYSASWDDTASAWVLPLSDLIDLARSRLTRTFTPDECQQYLHLEACPSSP